MLKQFFKHHEHTTDVISEAFVIGSSLYTIAIQILVTWAIFEDAEQYSRILPMNVPGAKGSEQDPSAKGVNRL